MQTTDAVEDLIARLERATHQGGVDIPAVLEVTRLALAGSLSHGEYGGSERLRTVYLASELEMELDYARTALDTPHPSGSLSILSAHPWWNEYVALHEALSSLVNSRMSKPPQHIAVIGCGPLPIISALFGMAGAFVTGFERNADAANLARRIVRAENLGHTLEIVEADGRSAVHSGCDLIYIANGAICPGIVSDLVPKADGAPLLFLEASLLTIAIYPSVDRDELADAGYGVVESRLMPAGSHEALLAMPGATK